MKSTIILTALIVISRITFSQNIGIGTTAPSANAILDISSNSKGLLLPRLNDTSVVVNPSAGLLIYNQQTKSPNYHNGISWRNLNINNVSEDDSVTCKFDAYEFDIISYTQEGYRDTDIRGRPTSSAYASTCTFGKLHDYYSEDFKNYLYVTPNHRFSHLEFNFYKRNTSSPYYTIQYEDGYVIRIKESYSGDGELIESITITAPTIIFDTIEFSHDWPIN